MTILFISDLHLSPEQPQITDLFKRFMQTQAKQAESLYILGDFFDTWIGDDNNTDFNQMIKKILKNATHDGLKIFIMHGNRDFLLGSKFMQQTGCQLINRDTQVIRINGKDTLIMHGDTLCTADKGYQRLRTVIRNKFILVIYRCLPLAIRQGIAAKLRQHSSSDIKKKPIEIMDVVQTDVVNVMQLNKVKHLIHGHTHRPNTHHFDLESELATRTVLGAWHEKGSVLVCDKDSWQLIEIQ